MTPNETEILRRKMMSKCKYYDKAFDVCVLHSDWSSAMPVLQPCVEGTCTNYTLFTNYDKIKRMNLDDMERFFKALSECDMCNCDDCFCYSKKGQTCVTGYTRKWLESEVDE